MPVESMSCSNGRVGPAQAMSRVTPMCTGIHRLPGHSVNRTAKTNAVRGGPFTVWPRETITQVGSRG